MSNNEVINDNVRKNADEPVLLKMENIEKAFPGVKALDNVSLTVKAGTVHALMGENGAGKSTLMKCLFGVYTKDSGKIYLEGKEINFKNSKEALENGVAMVHQELNQALKRNVMDNMWLGRFPTVAKGVPFTSEQKMYNATKEIFNKLEIDVDPKTVMSRMPVSQRQMVEIAKAVSYNSKIIVFDEPTSSLTEQEVEHLFKIINMLRDQGCGIIYISHKMAEILRISDEVTIMRDGKYITTRDAKELTTDDIIKLMVGRELTNLYPPKTNTIGDVLLDVKELSAEYSKLRDVSFSARRGEILGVAGLDGSGRTELLENLFGVATRRSGKLTLDGKPIRNRNARESIKNGFALLTEERRATGIFGILNIRENATVSSLNKCRIGPFLSKKKLKKNTDWCIDSMHVKTPTQETKIRSLSGGNQQKVILGRWLLTEPTVLLLDEPTRGIDVGAKYEIYELIIDLAARGKTVIMVSSEMPELLGVCDRILVMSGGRLAGEVNAADATQEEIMALAAKYA
ncbi:MAG: sugar ABC transporter ATP-binding protein [Acutalibacteraceae bacterium]